MSRAFAAGRVAGAEAQLRVHQDTARDRRDAAADAREVVQTLAARRLAGIAAELAGHGVELVFSPDAAQQFVYMVDGVNNELRIIDRASNAVKTTLQSQ